jgi:hypothetical protein
MPATTHDDDDHDDEFPFIEFVAADSLLQGIEAHADFQLRAVRTRGGLDYVRGRLRIRQPAAAADPAVPHCARLHYQRRPSRRAGSGKLVASQTRVFGEETPTDGYHLSSCSPRTRSRRAGCCSTITARLDNATNTLYRNHLSLIKDFVPEMGRNFKLVYSVRF